MEEFEDVGNECDAAFEEEIEEEDRPRTSEQTVDDHRCFAGVRPRSRHPKTLENK